MSSDCKCDDKKSCECGKIPSTSDIVTALIVELKTNTELIALLKGDKGDKGDLTSIDIDELAAKLPPIYPMWIDEQGSVIDSIPGGVRLGETMPLRIKMDVNLIRQAVEHALRQSHVGAGS